MWRIWGGMARESVRNGREKFQRISVGKGGEGRRRWWEQGQVNVALTWIRGCGRERRWHCIGATSLYVGNKGMDVRSWFLAKRRGLSAATREYKWAT